MEENKKDDVKTASKPAKNKSDKKNSKSIKTFFNEHKAELKRITWPSRKEVSKETVTVILVALLIGAIIFGMDEGLLYVYNAFISFTSKM